jgi:hypothetical protein
MIIHLVVRPFLKNDMLNLASHFVSYGYLEGNGIIYVFLEDNKGRTKAVTNEIIATWSENWIFVNAEFEQFLQSDADLRVFLGKKCSWSGMGITGCKLGYPLSMKIMASTDPGIFQWRALSW